MINFKNFSQINIKAVLYFIIILFVGIYSFKDFGMNWDENTNREIGGYAMFYAHTVFDKLVLNKIEYTPDYYDYGWQTYGPAFEAVLYIVEKAFNLTDTRDIYLMRHFCIFLTYWIGLIFFYKIIKYQYKSTNISLLGTTFFFITPLFFLESFTNSRDLTFMSFGIMTAYFLIQFLEKKSFQNTFSLAFISAFAIDIRVPGTIFVMITIAFLIVDIIKNENSIEYLKNNIYKYFLYLLSLIVFIYIFWPYLWDAPVANYLRSFTKMSQYLGPKFAPKWYFIPYQYFIHIPLLYSVLFIIGLSSSIYIFAKNNIFFYKNTEQRTELIILAFFILPLISIIIFKSTVFLRHMYFIYPFIILIIVIAIKRIIIFLQNQKTIYTYGFYSILGIQIIFLIYFIIQTHPNQEIFRNELFWNKKVQTTMSYRTGLEYLLENNIDNIPIRSHAHKPVFWTSKILKEKQRLRLNYNTDLDTFYHVTHLDLKTDVKLKIYPEMPKVIDSIQLKTKNGIGILNIYKITNIK